VAKRAPSPGLSTTTEDGTIAAQRRPDDKIVEDVVMYGWEALGSLIARIASLAYTSGSRVTETCYVKMTSQFPRPHEPFSGSLILGDICAKDGRVVHRLGSDCVAIRLMG